jgi:hypothetical protein
VRANRLYRLIVSRQGREPAFLAGPERMDRIELVAVEDGEVVLLWDLPAKEASRLLKALRADLAAMDSEEFMHSWEGTDTGAA